LLRLSQTSISVAVQPTRELAESQILWVDWLRQAAEASLTGVNQDAAALVLGLGIGDSSLVSSDLSQAMKTVGLTHLVAVSGANCAIVVGAVYLLLRRLSIRSRVFVSLLALLCYVLIVGGQPSVLRAAVMATAVLLAQLTGRKSSGFNLLALSVLILLIADPTLALSYSFALSVAATAGLLLLTPELARRLQPRFGRSISLVLAATIAAQIMCLPILLQLQAGLTTYSVFANLLAEPLVAPITVLSITAVIFSFIPWLASALFYLASLLAAVIIAVVFVFANLPMAITPWFDGLIATIMAIVFSLALIVLIKSKVRWKRAGAAAVAALSLLTSGSMVFNSLVKSASWPQVDWQIASCDVGQGDATVIRSGGKFALIDVGRIDPKIEACLSRLGVERIELLVLTHYDFDHVGSLTAAVHGREVGHCLLTPFKDDRPAASFTQTQVRNTGCQVHLAESGLNGKLGEVSWRVLTPSKSAAEAEDSNDGSVTMLFRFEDFSLITLADLGEKGQMRIASDLTSWRDEWVSGHDLIMKVSHHGSADQYHELLEYLHPSISLISVGRGNGYGHPTQQTLQTLLRIGSLICRTDLLGSVSISREKGAFVIGNNGAS
ncbi:MAG: hypothetical protein RL149_655, partial [Actinomycetota bacterium]